MCCSRARDRCPRVIDGPRRTCPAAVTERCRLYDESFVNGPEVLSDTASGQGSRKARQFGLQEVARLALVVGARSRSPLRAAPAARGRGAAARGRGEIRGAVKTKCTTAPRRRAAAAAARSTRSRPAPLRRGEASRSGSRSAPRRGVAQRDAQGEE
ncbi:hypothetical protein M885DRAFT_505581 [Pelagophyceae sp. CCMP2097]|nr:hypothetical protein M885DRAFT_505581 [Pelagophyceae sp. CCMP2097]